VRETGGSSGHRTAAIGGLFIVLVVLSAFWATALFAERLGQGRAEYLEEHHFYTMPDVLIYSVYRFRLDPQGVTETDLGPKYAPYRFRYDGLKLFARGDKKMVLIPYSWSTNNAFALVLPDDKDVRVVFAPNF
jgi:hypothetical protein